MGGDGGVVGGQVVAGDEDVLVGGAAAFGGDDVGVVGFGYFVNDAYKALFPASFVVVRALRGGCVVFGAVSGGRGAAVVAVCEAGLDVGEPGEVEGHD